MVLRSTFFLLMVAALSLAACRHVKPWERGKLAHPTMNNVGEHGPSAEHVHSVQEGAVGGSGGVESGCGCN